MDVSGGCTVVVIFLIMCACVIECAVIKCPTACTCAEAGLEVNCANANLDQIPKSSMDPGLKELVFSQNSLANIGDALIGPDWTRLCQNDGVAMVYNL